MRADLRQDPVATLAPRGLGAREQRPELRHTELVKTPVRAHVMKLGLALAASVVACSPQYVEPITRGSTVDPCLAWTTAEACTADQAHGCTVQPNRVGCRTTDPNCPAFTCQGGDPYVSRSGQLLLLHDEPFRFVGVNNWGIAWDPDGCKIDGFVDQEAALTRMFDDLVTLKATVARIWAFQPYAGPSGTDYSRFDNVVRHARRANVRLIFVLENGRKDNCSHGNERDDTWFSTTYQTPYDGNALSYPDYVQRLVKHYASEPTIMAWELMHEAGANDFSALNGFVRDMSRLIRNNDWNHLIVAGVNCDWGGTANSRSDGPPSSYAQLHAHETVDLFDLHEFGNASVAFSDVDASCKSIAESLNKPMFFGAIGIGVDGSSAQLQLRANQMKARIDSAFAHGFVGTLIYEYYPDWVAPSSGQTTCFDCRSSDPLGRPNGVAASAAELYNLPLADD